MDGIRCNKCLGIWVMHTSIESPPVACPYCGDNDSFSMRFPCESIETATMMFAEEERTVNVEDHDGFSDM